MMKILDLFAGAGGFSAGFGPPSTHSHLAVDNDTFPLGTYALNNPHAKTLQRDISKLHSLQIERAFGGAPDIIIASPPCEEFSLANPKSIGLAAERIYGTGTARLLLDTIRLIGNLAPDVFIIENVAALLRAGGREIAIREFERIGIYDIYFNLVRAHQHGNPSKRLRLFMSNVKLKLPRSHSPTVMDAIGNLPPLGLNAFLSPSNEVPNHVYRPATERNQKLIKKARWGFGAKQFRGPKGRTMPNWVRLHPNESASSIIGLSRYIHPYEDRLLTVREHARLMSYPDGFVFTGPIESQYNQVGESVPPLISKLIAKEVQTHLE
jgi:DNA (cytosine-5)-methyltransferase 1